MSESSESQRSYEEMFADRFTSEDREYQQYVTRPADPPPIVEDWRGRGGGNQRGRDNRYQDRRGHGGGRGWGGDRGWRGEHRGEQQWHDRDRDRDRERDRERDRDRERHSGHGSGYQSSNQGYNSYQRPSYDRY